LHHVGRRSVWLTATAGRHGTGSLRRAVTPGSARPSTQQQGRTPRIAQEVLMDARLDMSTIPVGRKFGGYLVSASRLIKDSPLPAATHELVNIRASQINGCGFCVDMHTKDAAHDGETAQRINLVATWREATVFTEAERAALELAEQGTRLADASP